MLRLLNHAYPVLGQRLLLVIMCVFSALGTSAQTADELVKISREKMKAGICLPREELVPFSSISQTDVCDRPLKATCEAEFRAHDDWLAAGGQGQAPRWPTCDRLQACRHDIVTQNAKISEYNNYIQQCKNKLRIAEPKAGANTSAVIQNNDATSKITGGGGLDLSQQINAAKLGAAGAEKKNSDSLSKLNSDFNSSIDETTNSYKSYQSELDEERRKLDKDIKRNEENQARTKMELHTDQPAQNATIGMIVLDKGLLTQVACWSAQNSACMQARCPDPYGLFASNMDCALRCAQEEMTPELQACFKSSQYFREHSQIHFPQGGVGSN